MRTAHKDGTLPLLRKKRLDELGFVWDVLATTWETRLAELKQYKSDYGHCDVLRDAKYPQLGRWVVNVRTRRKQGRLSAEQTESLDALGFSWNALEARWERMFAELKRYKETFGNTNVRRAWADNPQLATWVQEQRSNQNKGKLPAARTERLAELGFVVDPHDVSWQSMFDELRQYKATHGDCNVPQSWSHNRRLALWVTAQRTKNRNGTLASTRKVQLDALGFDWNPKANERRISPLAAE
jgi:hypothetical protein